MIEAFRFAKCLDTLLNRRITMKIFAEENRLAPFFWVHGESKEILKKEIQAVSNLGIKSICIESRTHEQFCEDEWWSDLRFMLGECKKRGMKAWILDDKRCPTGWAAGALDKEENSSLRAWGITETHIDIVGNAEDIGLLTKHHVSDGEKIISIVACRHSGNGDLLRGDELDLTNKEENGMLYFSLPEGMWRIFIIKKSRKGISPFWIRFVDMLNPASVDLLIENVYEKHYANIKDEFGKTFLGFFSDEPGFHNNSAISGGSGQVKMGESYTHYPYSDKLINCLNENFNGDARKALVGLWADFEDGREAKIRYKYMDFITKEYRDNFCNRLGSWCKKHNIKYIGHIIEDNRKDAETNAGCGHYFRALDGQDMSGVDVVLTQLIPGMKNCNHTANVSARHTNYNFYKYMLAKLGSSMAHLDPKKKGNAMCEIFGAFGWVEGTKTMKWLSDHMLVRGINFFVPHAFSAKENDTDCPPIFYYRGRNPQYKYIGKITKYLERGAAVISGGRHMADCAILYDAEIKWMNKETIALEDIAKELYTRQIDYDIVPSDYLSDAEVKNEELLLNGETFKTLIVPYGRFMADEIINKLVSLKNRGADVIFVNSIPENIREEFTFINLSELPYYIKKKGTECEIDIESEDICTYHYVKDGRNIYMLTNEGINDTLKFNLKTNVEIKKAALYDAAEDKLTEAKMTENGIEIELPPYNSVFVIEGADGDAPKQKAEEKMLSLSWKVSLAEQGNEKFKFYKETDKLFNVTGRNELPEFSGHIKYEANFFAEKGSYVLDLGYVGEIAEINVNGKNLGSRVYPPYAFDISEALINGDNKLEITVTNSNVFALKDQFSGYIRIEPSGLLGPLKLVQYE